MKTPNLQGIINQASSLATELDAITLEISELVMKHENEIDKLIGQRNLTLSKLSSLLSIAKTDNP